jgi:uncharacterized membrane protein
MTLTKIKKMTRISSSQRFIELDVLRGVAIILMIFFHVLWDLDYFGILALNTKIYEFQKIAPIMFFLLLGMCLIVSKNNKKECSPEKQRTYKVHLILRGLKIFSFGMILTTITLLMFPDRPIIFGVLHCLGLSIILSIPFISWKVTSKIVLATGVISTGFILGVLTMTQPTAIHLALGLHQNPLWKYTIDYFPIFPWFGVCLLGMALADIFYKGNERRFKIPDLSTSKPAKMFSWLGRHSLTIYLIHQPILAGIFFLTILF